MTSDNHEFVFEKPNVGDRVVVAQMLADDMATLGILKSTEDLLNVSDLVLENDGCSSYCLIVRPEKDGPAVGILLANLLFSVKFAGRALWIENLYVAKGWRERGLGRQLIEHMLDWAESNDIKGIDLEAYQGNTPAAILYRSVGFRRLSRERFFFDFDWVETDSGVWPTTNHTP